MIGHFNNGNVFLDHVNIYGINIHGNHAGGLIGTMENKTNICIYNCGVHGESDSQVTVPTGNYSIQGYRQAGGLVGYRCNNNANIKYGSTTFSNDIDGCYVNDYTIEQYQNDNSGGAAGIIACYENNRSRVIANTMVSDCYFASNGQGDNRGMGGIIGWMKGNNGVGVQGYNITVNNLTFGVTTPPDNTQYNGYARTKACYGLICGCPDNSPSFKIVGYTRQGTNTVNVAFYDKITNCPRPVEFDIGRKYDSNDLDSIVPNAYNSSSYIIYSDYNGASLSSTTRKANLSDYTLATNVSKAIATDDNFPYATSSPFRAFGNNKFITGDGVSPSDTAGNIIAQYNDSDYIGKQ